MSNVRIKGVLEQDIDLLLLEEFVASPQFLAWFLGQIQLPSNAILADAARSVSTTTGESDLELTLKAPLGVVKVLIENKVGAAFQLRQAERYRERAENYKRNQSCFSAVTTIIAPQAYFGQRQDALGFDHRVFYETILNWFLDSVGLGMRGEYKCTLLRTAIERGNSGWILVPDAIATLFWCNYWELADAIAPELQMRKPEDKPATSAFVRFYPAALPSKIWLRHGLPYGNVHLLFSGQGKRLEDLQRQIGHKLTAKMRLERAQRSAAIRISVPVVDQSVPFSSAESAVREALRTALELLAWYNCNLVEPEPTTEHFVAGEP